MNKCTIRFIRKDQTSKKDDVLIIYEDEEFDEMYRIRFRPAGCDAKEFYLEHGRAVDYVAGILKTLQYDADPFQYVQVDTPMTPSVLYRGDDLCREVRYAIEDTISVALRRPIGRVA